MSFKISPTSYPFATSLTKPTKLSYDVPSDYKQTGRLYTLSQKLLSVVKDPESESVVIGDFVARRALDKIRFFANAFGQYYYSYYATKLSSLANLEVSSFDKGQDRTIHLVRSLIEIVRGFNNMDFGDTILSPEDQAINAAYALKVLSSIDPRIENASKLAQKVLQYDLSYQKADRDLIKWQENCTKPLTITYPIKPHILRSLNSQFLDNLTIEEKLFWKITTIYVGANRAVLLENLHTIGIREHFICKESASVQSADAEWIRDFGLLLDDGSFIVPSPFTPDQSQHIRDKLQDFTANSTCYSVAILGATARMRKEFNLEDVPSFKYVPFYFEGGNIIPAITPQGKIYLCGAHNILHTFIAHRDSFFEANLHHVPYFKEQYKQRYTPEQIASCKAALQRAEIDFPALHFDQESLAISALLTMEIIKLKMEKDFKAPVVVIGDFFSEPVQFHLDTYIAIAPGMKAFLQDYPKTVIILRRLLSNPFLSKDDEKRLKQYLHFALGYVKNFSAETRLVKFQLEQAGFTVHQVPALYHAYGDIFSINYLNGIFGIADNSVYFITNGSLHPVDELLRNEFLASLQEKGIDRVYFTGRKNTDSISSLGKLEYLEADMGLELQGGVNCSTFHLSAEERNPLALDQINILFQRIQDSEN